MVALLALSIVWIGWLLWVFLIFTFSRVRVSPMDDVTAITPGQKALAAAMLVLFVLVFTPLPLVVVP